MSLPTPRGTQALRGQVMFLLKKDASIPSLSTAAHRLMELLTKPDVTVAEVAEVVNLETGLAAKVLRLANSVAFGGKSIQTAEDALMRIGMREIRRLSLAIGVMDRVSNMNVKVDWNMFWLHSLLVARVSELLADAYRPLTGREYLSGLMHDAGKLFFEHHFPAYFEEALHRAMQMGCGMHQVERQMYDITHAEVGALLCEKWQLHREVTRAVRFHHEPESPFNKDNVDLEHGSLLAICVSIADTLANMCDINIAGRKRFAELDPTTLPSWRLLEKHAPRRSLDLNLERELQRASETVAVFGGKGVAAHAA